jgi:hypothetical protein
MGVAHLLLFATAAMSQTNSSADVSSEITTNRFCNSSISAANASGIITYDPRDPYRSGDAPAHSWAMTITGGNGQEIQRKFWYDTAGQNYADDVGLGMDVCAFPNFYLPLNAHRRGQNDPGNCSTVFSQPCVDAVTSMASQSALKWVRYSSPPPYENLTAGVLPSICNYIANELRETIKKECGAQMLSDDGITANFENPLGECFLRPFDGNLHLLTQSHSSNRLQLLRPLQKQLHSVRQQQNPLRSRLQLPSYLPRMGHRQRRRLR